MPSCGDIGNAESKYARADNRYMHCRESLSMHQHHDLLSTSSLMSHTPQNERDATQTESSETFAITDNDVYSSPRPGDLATHGRLHLWGFPSCVRSGVGISVRCTPKAGENEYCA